MAAHPAFPAVMGVLNVTPDSFSDGGSYPTVDQAVAAGLQMVAEGAAILDIGGESTRPGARSVCLEEELARVIPVIEVLRAGLVNHPRPIWLSVDTSKTAVMQAAIEAGADVINDVNALQAPGALAAIAKAKRVNVCLMHKQGSPHNMQANPQYQDVVLEVREFLKARLQACHQAGIGCDRIWLDPGFGFGKTLQHNLMLMKHIQKLAELGQPVLIGVSRKSMIGQILQCELDERLVGGLALAAWSLIKGASIIRTHEIKATVDLIKMLSAVESAELYN